MGIKHFTWATDLEWEYDSPTQRYVFLEATYQADKKGILRMSQTDLAQRLLLSRQTVSREFSRLQELGLLRMLNHGRYGIRFNGSEPAKVNEKAVETRVCRTCGGEMSRGEWAVYYTRSGEEHAYHREVCDPHNDDRTG